MLTRIQLRRFKAFERFTVGFGEKVVLVGPNSAGKSTIIAALRAGAGMLRHARARNPNRYEEDLRGSYLAYDLESIHTELETENLRYEFHAENETRLKISFSGGGELNAVWPGTQFEQGAPPQDEDEYEDDISIVRPSFFYLAVRKKGDVRQPKRAADVRSGFPALGVIPSLTPLELHERQREPDYVRSNLSSRLSSRHFRNQLWLLYEKAFDQTWDDFRAFVDQWLPEISFSRPEVHQREKLEIDVYYREGRTPKEIAWAGDGFQVFLQLLFHIFRLQGAETLVLDEPDLYLHADLQRRLIQVLDSVAPQVIVATHSSEMLVEAPPDSMIWVDKSRTKGIASPDPVRLSELSRQIGTRFNLRLAKALQSRVVIFVEGEDMRILQNVAQTLGLTRVAAEQDLAIIPIEGFTNWRRLEGFGWLTEKLLEGSVEGFVILDRDYHSENGLMEAKKALRKEGLHSHIWMRKELESYFLSPEVLARVCALEAQWFSNQLKELADNLRPYVLSRLQSYRIEERPDRAKHQAEALEEAAREVDAIWLDEEGPVWRCPAKDLFGGLNKALQALGRPTVSARKVAKVMAPAEVDSEMVQVLQNIEELAS